MQNRARALACALGVTIAVAGFVPTALATFPEEDAGSIARTTPPSSQSSSELSSAPRDHADSSNANAGTHSVMSALESPAQSLADLSLSTAASLPLPTEQTTLAQSATMRLDDVEALSIAAQEEQARTEAELTGNMMLSWDPALIAAVGSQAASGHASCCPGYACAYGDAIVQGIANDHAAYGCGCCTWPNWGGGDSSYRDLGSGQAVLREAYDQINAGYPTVAHVRARYGQHWVTLVGYQNVDDPGALSTDNFLCLDPWDGQLYTLSDQFDLYGDNCQHVSDRSVIA